MSVTKVELVNMGLRLMGVERINDLTDNNKRAQVMTDLYEIGLRAVLCDADWSFARKRTSISSLVSTPAFGWNYQFNRPSDCLNIVQEYNDEPFEVEDTTILADVATLYLIYTRYIDDPSKFSAGFCTAFAHWLAWKGSFSITGDKTLQDRLEKQYYAEIANARFQNSKDNSPMDPVIEDFTLVRL